GGRSMTVSVSTSTGMVLLRASSGDVPIHVSSRRAPREAAGQAIEHRAPPVAMRCGDRLGELAVDETELGRTLALGLELHGDQAGPGAGERGHPGEHQAPRGVDLDVFAD